MAQRETKGMRLSVSLQAVLVLVISAITAVSVGQSRIPGPYQPMTSGHRFNSNEPMMVPNGTELSRLKFQTPQWLAQFLSFPPPSEIEFRYGEAPADVRAKAGQAIRQALAGQYLPEKLDEHLIPMSGWAVLYEDWINHGGTDVFLTKFIQDHYVLQIAETHNHIIVLIRDLDNQRTEDFARMLKLTYKYADSLLNEQFKPVSTDALRLFRTNLSPPYVYGFYSPKMEVLSNRDSSSDLMTSGGLPNERSTSARASAVRFFCNGDFAGFMILKPLFGAEMRNPFDARFKKSAPDSAGEVPFWDRPQAVTPQQAGSEEQITRRQVEEYLGNYFYDQKGNKLSQRIPIKELERAFRELSREQQLEIVRRKMIDEFYTSGTESFAAGDIGAALGYWTNILKFDPENPRAAILLQMGIRMRTQSNYDGSLERARYADERIAAALEAIEAQQTVLSLKREQKQQDQVRESAVVNFRTRALDFLSEGNYRDSLNEWNKLLNVDPGNASALIFKEICEQKLRERPKQN